MNAVTSRGDVTSPISSIPTQSGVPTVNTRSAELDESRSDNEIEDGEECDSSVDINQAKDMLLQAILWLKIHSQLESNTATAKLGIKSLPFLQPNAGNIFMALGDPSTTDDLAEHQKRLDDTLAAWNFQRVLVDGDGDCLFQSIAWGLLQLASSGDPHALTTLEECSISCMDMEPLIAHLRQVVVTEWMGPNSGEYQAFLTSTHDQLLAEAPQFLQRGVHSGDLGDLVLTAIANTLRMPVVVFTSAPNFPFTTILPTHNKAATSQPLYIALTQCGAGHYDAVVQAPPTSDSDEDGKDVDNQVDNDGTMSCTCGRKKNKSAQSKACTLTDQGYITRCPCYKATLPCTHRCRCKECHNPLGKTPKPAVMPAAKRKRAHHPYQEHSLMGRKGKEFMLQVGELPKTGPWTTFEYLTAAVILRGVEDGTADGEEIYNILDAIKAVADAVCLKVALPPRSKEEMQKLFSHCMHKYTETSKTLQ